MTLEPLSYWSGELKATSVSVTDLAHLDGTPCWRFGVFSTNFLLKSTDCVSGLGERQQPASRGLVLHQP